MACDPTPLLDLASELEGRGDALRSRAFAVASAPDRVRWSSAGARAWAHGVDEIWTLLLRAAADVEDAAATSGSRARALAR